MPRHRRPRPPPLLDDRDLAAEVHYLHSLWRRGPPAPAPAPAPAPVPVPAAAVPNQSRTKRRRPDKRTRHSLRSSAADPEGAGPKGPHAPSPSASASSPEESTPPSPGSPTHPGDAEQEDAVSDHDPVPSRSARRKANKRRRRGLECDAAQTQDDYKPWPEADGPKSSKPPPQPPSPGSLAHREALRSAEAFFARHGSEDEDDEEASESAGDEEAAGFFTGLFEGDAALRGYYERGWEERLFACMACAGKKTRRGRGKRFRGCLGLVQHARTATRYGRAGAHRALATVTCRVLGWDIDRLPSIVIDPRGTLGHELAARAQSSDALESKEDVETGMEGEGSVANDDETANELVTSEVPAGMKDVEEIAPLNCEDGSKNNVYGHETKQEEVAVKTGTEEPVSTDCEKEVTELNVSKESSEKDNANKDNSSRQDNNGVAHEQDIAIESTEKNNMMDTCSTDAYINDKNCMKASVQEEVEPEHSKAADDTETPLLGVNPMEENVNENKEHDNSIS